MVIFIEEFYMSESHQFDGDIKKTERKRRTQKDILK